MCLLTGPHRNHLWVSSDQLDSDSCFLPDLLLYPGFTNMKWKLGTLAYISWVTSKKLRRNVTPPTLNEFWKRLVKSLVPNVKLTNRNTERGHHDYQIMFFFCCDGAVIAYAAAELEVSGSTPGSDQTFIWFGCLLICMFVNIYKKYM